MGCTSSKSAKVATTYAKLDRDPDDFELDPVDMETTGIEEFDKLFERAAESLNIIIDMNNTINDCITNIKDTIALMTGVYRVELRGGNDTDNIFLDLLNTDGSRPSLDDVEELLEQEDIEQVDARLAEAKEDLLEALELASSHVRLSLKDGDTLAADQPTVSAPLEKFNAELAAFRNALGSKYKVVCKVKAAVAPLSKCVRISVCKPVWIDEEDEEPQLKLVTVLDMAATPYSDQIQFHLAAVHSLCDKLTLELKGADYNLEFLKKKIKPPGHADIDTKLRRVALRNAINAVNAELFKLHKVCFNMSGDINIVTAVIEVVESMKRKVRRVAEDRGIPPDDAVDSVLVHPMFEMREDASFDFNVHCEIDPELGMAEFPDCLTPAARLSWYTVMDTKDLVVELVGQFPNLKDQVEHLVEECKEFVDKAAESASNAGLGMMEAVKAAKHTALNVKELSTSVKIFTTFIATCKRIGDELTKAVEDLILMNQHNLHHSIENDLNGIQEEGEDNGDHDK